MKRGIFVLEIGIWLCSGIALIATFVWPSLEAPAKETATRRLAEAAIGQIAAGEQGALKRLGHYVAFGPPDQERRAALPQVQLDAGARAFQFDALVQADGSIQLRAVTTPESIANGTVIPLLITRQLSPPARDAGSADAENAR